MLLLLQMDNLISMFMSSSAIMGLLGAYKFLMIPFGIVLIILICFFIRRCRKKKRRRQQFTTPPVSQIIGSDSEQLEELNKELAPFGFKYEPYQDIFYSILNSWQSEFGYCRLYDEATAPLSMIIDCEPIRFEYAGKRWLIEFWKGQYGMTTGGEVGIYYTEGPDLNIPGVFNGTFYYCVKDEDRINMSFALRKNGNLLFTRHGYHWWLTGFKLGEFSHPEELTMDIMLDLYDKEMVNAFVTALKKVGYKENEFAVHGRRVYIHFDKPHTPQPLTRTALTEFIMQKNNENLCRMYARLTADYTDTLDKLQVLRQKSPDMYNQILNVGKPRGVFESFMKIKGFLSNREINGKD